MEYQVPQFIEVENKVVGPLTFRQFIYLAGTAGICVVFFSYFQIIFAILFSLPVAGLGIALAFYKVNGKPFIEMLEAGFSYYTGDKLLLWKHTDEKIQKNQVSEAPAPSSPRAPRLTRGKLSELAWSLDVKQENRPDLES